MILTEIGDTVKRGGGLGREVGSWPRWPLGNGLGGGLGRRTGPHQCPQREPERATVTFLDGRVEQARVLGIDVDADLALLGVDTGDVEAITWPRRICPVDRRPVVGLANPGGRGLRATLGFVASAARSFRGRAVGDLQEASSTPPSPLPAHRVGPWSIWTGCWLVSTPAVWARVLSGAGCDDRDEGIATSTTFRRQPEPRRLGVGLAPVEVTRRRRSMGLDEATVCSCGWSRRAHRRCRRGAGR